MKITVTSPWGLEETFKSTKEFQREILLHVQRVLRDRVIELFEDTDDAQAIEDVQSIAESLKRAYAGFDEAVEVAAYYGYRDFKIDVSEMS